MPKKGGRFKRAARRGVRRARAAFRKKTPEKGVIENILYADGALGMFTTGAVENSLIAAQRAAAGDMAGAGQAVQYAQQNIADAAFSGAVLKPIAEGVVLDLISKTFKLRHATKINRKWSWL